MKKFVKNLLYLICLVVILIIPYFVFADSSALGKLQEVGIDGGYRNDTNQFTAAEIVGTVVSVLFSILGIIFTILILYGGYNWMTAMGDNAKVEKAKNTIWRAVIGLIVIAGSYAIGAFVWFELIKMTKTTQ